MNWESQRKASEIRRRLAFEQTVRGISFMTTDDLLALLLARGELDRMLELLVDEWEEPQHPGSDPA